MSTSAPDAPLPWEAHRWRLKVLFATYFAYVGYYLTRKTFSYCKTSIATEFDWGLDATAHIWTAFLFAYMIGQFINSYLGRKYGPRVLLLGGLALSMGCNVVFGFANSFATFIVFMFFNGLFQASGWPGCVGSVAEWLRQKERGSIMGFWSTNYLIGNLISKAVAGKLLEMYGWRWSFFGLTLLSVVIWFIIYFWQRNKPEDVGLEPIVQKDPQDDKRTIRASQSEHIRTREYFRLALNPVILTMGISYFCIKFLRYALDSWLPTFLNLKGLDVAHSAYSSILFDVMGLAGAILTGIALDRYFRGNWPKLCFCISLGMVAAYALMFTFGTSPLMTIICSGFIGLMVYGPDTILAGAAAVQVAGEKNGVAVAGIVNGIASMGPILQEQVVGQLVKDDPIAGMNNANILGLAMSIVFSILMVVMMWRYQATHRDLRAADDAARLSK